MQIDGKEVVECPFDNCNLKFKNNGSLQGHLSRAHSKNNLKMLNNIPMFREILLLKRVRHYTFRKVLIQRNMRFYPEIMILPANSIYFWLNSKSKIM